MTCIIRLMFSKTKSDAAGKLRLDDLNDLHDERCAKVVVLASSAMNGLKPDREDAKTRLLAFSERATGGKSV